MKALHLFFSKFNVGSVCWCPPSRSDHQWNRRKSWKCFFGGGETIFFLNYSIFSIPYFDSNHSYSVYLWKSSWMQCAMGLMSTL
jgi:hypothetical protein